MRSNLLLAFVKGPNVLDVGCAGHVPEPDSPGWVHGALRKLFPKTVTGIDINRENIEKLEKLGYNSLYVMNAEEFELNQRFDTIVAGELIEHLANPGRFLQQCHKHLNSDGRIVLTTPHPFSLLYSMYAFLKFPRTCQNLEHTCWFCPQTLDSLAARCGFKIAHWELIEDYQPNDTSWKYRSFARLVTFFRFIIPRRLRCNGLLFVLHPNVVA